MNRTDLNDALGAADLQADVMRFLAMVALTILAVSTIGVVSVGEPTVDSPAPPPTDPPDELSASLAEDRSVPPIEATPQPPMPAPAVVAGPDATLAHPATVQPEPVPATQDTPQILEEPERRAAAAQSSTAHAADEPAAPPPEKAPSVTGFTLRFESDAEFRRALRSGHAGLHARTDAGTFTFDARNWRFVPSRKTTRAHGVSGHTLPGDLIAAIVRAAGSAPDTDTGWAVSLADATAARLAGAMRDADGGQLILDGAGQVRLTRVVEGQ